MALIANFIAVPATALILFRVIPVGQYSQIALVLLGWAAGAHFLPRLVQIAKVDIAFAAEAE